MQQGNENKIWKDNGGKTNWGDFGIFSGKNDDPPTGIDQKFLHSTWPGVDEERWKWRPSFEGLSMKILSCFRV